MNWGLVLGVGIPVIAVVGITRYVYRTYNELTWHLLKVDKQASNVEVHLKKRYDLIPALVEAVKGYAKHESGTFTEVTRLRSQWGASKSINEKVKNANALESALSKLLVVQERYPQLRANKNFQSLQKSMSHVEGELVHERKYYNEKVRAYNVRVRLFPRNIVAKLFGFKERDFFSLEE
jgi:LemA protein